MRTFNKEEEVIGVCSVIAFILFFGAVAALAVFYGGGHD